MLKQFGPERVLRFVFLLALPLFAHLSAPLALAQSTGIGGRVIAEDGRPLAGAQIEANATNGAMFTANTDDDGRFLLQGIPLSRYTLTASLEGFLTSDPVVPNVLLNEVSRAAFVLAPVVPDGVPTVRAIVNAASNLPSYLPQAAISPGSMVVGFANNAGPAELVRAQQLPLGTELGGFSALIEMNGQEYPLHPVFVISTQFAAVVDSATPTGVGDFIVEYNGVRSAPFRVTVAASQPGFFTVSQNGQGPGIFTRADFSLITPRNSARPGDVVIAWGTDASQFDDTAGVQNRAAETPVRLFLGNRQVSDGDVVYFGPSAGFAGGLQAIFRVSEGVPNGCAAPFFAEVEVEGDVRRSNTVTLPVSSDGQTCSDAHGLPDRGINAIYPEGTHGTLRAVLTETRAVVGDRSFDSAQVRLFAERVDRFSYQAPPTLQSCRLGWRPQGFSPPAPVDLPLTGVYRWNLPTDGEPVNVFLSSLTGVQPYTRNLEADEIASLRAGESEWGVVFDFQVGDQVFTARGTVPFSRNPFMTRDFVDAALRDRFLETGFVSLADFLAAVNDPASPNSGVIAIYRMVVNNGQLGEYTLECALAPGQTATSIAETYRRSLRSLPAEIEFITLDLIYRDENTENIEVGDSSVEATEHVNRSVSTYRIDIDDYERAIEAGR